MATNEQSLSKKALLTIATIALGSSEEIMIPKTSAIYDELVALTVRGTP